jgi:hypothetical protein
MKSHHEFSHLIYSFSFQSRLILTFFFRLSSSLVLAVFFASSAAALLVVIMSVNTRLRTVEISEMKNNKKDVLDLIKDQNKRLYKIQKQKVEAKLNILNVRLIKEELKLIYLQKRFDARIATIKTLISETKIAKKNDENESNEILSKMKVLSLQFSRLS